VAARAGPRYEPNAGAAHALKNFAFKSTKERSALRIVRETELNGGVLSATMSREHLLLTAEFLKSDKEYFAQLLAEVIGSQKLCRFEYNEDVVPSMIADVEQAASSPLAIGIDSLYTTAFRNRSIGSSLFASPGNLPTIESVRGFGQNALNGSNIALISSGLSNEELSDLASKHFGGIPSGARFHSEVPQYFGGDYRRAITDAHGHALPHDHFFFAFEGQPRGSNAPLAVLAQLLGGGQSPVKWSKSRSVLAQIPGANVHAFNTSFQDTGLFGVHVAAPTDMVHGAAKVAANELRAVAGRAPTHDALKAAIAQAKFARAMAYEGSRELSHETVAAGLLGGEPANLGADISLLEGVKAEDVSAAAQALLKSKPTSVALGDLKKLPYADELF